MNIRPRHWTASFALIALLPACGEQQEREVVDETPEVAALADGTPAEMDHSAHMPDGMETLNGDGPWTRTSTLGSHVTLSAPAMPMTAGTLRVSISVHAQSDGAAASSVDLVSPTMPMHGVARFPVEEGEAEIEIPMEGAWALYVNLDPAGADSAEFLFAVTSGDAPAGSHH